VRRNLVNSPEAPKCKIHGARVDPPNRRWSITKKCTTTRTDCGKHFNREAQNSQVTGTVEKKNPGKRSKRKQKCENSGTDHALRTELGATVKKKTANRNQCSKEDTNGGGCRQGGSPEPGTPSLRGLEVMKKGGERFRNTTGTFHLVCCGMEEA